MSSGIFFLERGTLNVELFFFLQSAPNSFRRQRGLANAHAYSAVDGVGNVGGHGILGCLATAFGAVGSDAVLVLDQMQFDFLRQIGKTRQAVIQD
jgi:hypothetical protein